MYHGSCPWCGRKLVREGGGSIMCPDKDRHYYPRRKVARIVAEPSDEEYSKGETTA